MEFCAHGASGTPDQWGSTEQGHTRWASPLRSHPCPPRCRPQSSKRREALLSVGPVHPHRLLAREASKASTLGLWFSSHFWVVAQLGQNKSFKQVGHSSALRSQVATYVLGKQWGLPSPYPSPHPSPFKYLCFLKVSFGH